MIPFIRSIQNRQIYSHRKCINEVGKWRMGNAYFFKVYECQRFTVLYTYINFYILFHYGLSWDIEQVPCAIQ